MLATVDIFGAEEISPVSEPHTLETVLEGFKAACLIFRIAYGVTVKKFRLVVSTPFAKSEATTDTLGFYFVSIFKFICANKIVED